MASIQEVTHGCSKILAVLLYYLCGRSPRSHAAGEAATFLIVVLSIACVAGVIVAHFADVVLAYLHPAGSAPAMSIADLGRFVVLVFALVSLWLLAIAVMLAFFLIARDLVGFQAFSLNVLHLNF